MPQAVGLHERDFVVGVGRVVGEALVVAVAQFVDEPDGDAGGGEDGVASGFLAVFDEVVFRGRSRLGEAVEGVEPGAGGAEAGGERGRPGQLEGGRPAGGALEVGAGLDGIGAQRPEGHEAVESRAPGIVVVVVEVGVVAEHVAVLVAEGAQLERVADVRDLVVQNGDVVGERLGGVVKSVVERPGVRPEAEVPDSPVAAGVEDVAGHGVARAVGRQRGELRGDLRRVVRQGLEDGDGVLDEEDPLFAAVLGRVVVVALGLGHADVGGDDVGVRQQAVGDVLVVLLHRAVVAEARVGVPVAEVDDVRARDRGGVVGEVDEQAEADFRARRLVCGRRERGPFEGRGVDRRRAGRAGGRRLESGLPVLPALAGAGARLPFLTPFRRAVARQDGIGAQMLWNPELGGVALPDAQGRGDEVASVVRLRGVVIAFVSGGEDDCIPLRRFEDGVEFIASTVDFDDRPVGLGEGEGLVEGGGAPGGGEAEGEQESEQAFVEVHVGGSFLRGGIQRPAMVVVVDHQ